MYTCTRRWVYAKCNVCVRALTSMTILTYNQTTSFADLRCTSACFLCRLGFNHQRGGSNRNRNIIEPIEAEPLT